MDSSVSIYNDQQSGAMRDICLMLFHEIPNIVYGDSVTSKVWHGAPVWFDDGNPVVGYWVRKDYVQLLFWSGQSFSELGLSPEGKFKAAEKRYFDASEVDAELLKKWLKESLVIQWDYKNIVKRRGELLLLNKGDK